MPVPFAAIMRAQKPTNSGDDRLVPPYCAGLPLTTMMAPLLGSASKAMSGTPRYWLPAFWPTPTCQLGIGSKVLGLPPVPDHTVSPCQVVVVALSVVPPTATTYGELAGQLGVVPLGLPPHSLEPASPVDTEKVWPCATACLKMLSAAAAEPSPFALVSHSPSETLITLTALALTTVLKSSTMLEFRRVGML